MKKFVSAILIFVLLTACSKETLEEEITSADTDVSESIATITEAELMKERVYPNTDGSTSAIPIDTSLCTAYLGKSGYEANHTTTHKAFERLLDGEVDLIYTVPLSDEQEKMAMDRNIILESIPLYLEAFVFVVNENNPVDNLTSSQIRDIYSGKITNWSELGGNDAEIVPYQRNKDSGSQNYMTGFMKGEALIEAPSEYIVVGMGSIMEAVASYDNGINSIGYSVYQYAAGMYKSEKGGIKFISVDGIEPTNQSISDMTYPLLSYNYIMYNKANIDKPVIKDFIEWIATDEGQAAILSSGYVPVGGKIIPETNLKLYDSKGTGPEKPEGYSRPRFYYTVNNLEYRNVYNEELLKKLDEIKGTYLNELGRFKGCYSEIRGLVDKQIEDKINARIKEMVTQLENETGAENASTYSYNITDSFKYFNYESVIMQQFEIINGYLSVMCLCGYDYDMGAASIETAVFDLYTGNELSLSDMYFSGADFVPGLNDSLRKGLNKQQEVYNETDNPDKLKREFYGLEESICGFTLNSVCFDKNGAYTYKTIYESFTPDYENMVIYTPRDMEGIFEDENAIVTMVMTSYEASVINRNSNGSHYNTFDDSVPYDAKKLEQINELILEISNGELYRDEVFSGFSQIYQDSHPNYAEEMRVNAGILGGKYLNITVQFIMLYGITFYFDLESMERLTIEHVAGKDWRERAIWTEGERFLTEYAICEEPDIDLKKINNVSYKRVRFTDGAVKKDSGNEEYIVISYFNGDNRYDLFIKGVVI